MLLRRHVLSDAAKLDAPAERRTALDVLQIAVIFASLGLAGCSATAEYPSMSVQGDTAPPVIVNPAPGYP